MCVGSSTESSVGTLPKGEAYAMLQRAVAAMMEVFIITDW